ALAGRTRDACASIAGRNATGMTDGSARALHAGARIADRWWRRWWCGRTAVGRDGRLSIGATNEHQQGEQTHADRGHGIASGASDAPTLRARFLVGSGTRIPRAWNPRGILARNACAGIDRRPGENLHHGDVGG